VTVKILLFAFAALLAGAPPLSAAPDGAARVTILQTTDLHDHCRGAGHLAGGPPDLGGYPRIAAYVTQVRATCGHPVLLVDSGDWSMGTIYDLTLGRRPLALWFADALRYDCITLGNHEFDDGPAGLAGVLGAAARGFGLRTPIVASNLDLGGDADLAPFLGPGKAIRGTVVETLANGLRVGFIGLMGRDAAGDAPAAPVRFTDYGADYRVVQTLVDSLRSGQGCRLVIALDHAGTDAAGAEGEDVDLARHVTGIDAIASGHTHNPLDSARTVANGAWKTLVFCAGAYGTNVSRVDLAWDDQAGAFRLEASENPAMTDAVLAALDPPGMPDPAFALSLARTDLELNRTLAPVLTGVARFGDYAAGDPARGIYHPVAGTAQDLQSNDRDAVPAPNGLGDLCADAIRAAANGLLAAGSPDPTPFTAALLAAGELRGGLDAGAPITFADLYGILPLGLSPDPAQNGSTGEPLVSGYVDDAGLRTLCAMQLLTQSGIARQADYLNLSGLSYGLRPAETAAFFSAASAVTALRLTGQRAEEGSTPAAQALAALAALASDRGAALLDAMAAGNPYAGAMVWLGDPDPGTVRIADNLALLGLVAGTERHSDAALAALLMAKAQAAIGTISAFAPADSACTGPAGVLAPGRHRIVLDLYVLLMANAAETRFGTGAPIYQAAQGDARLSGATPAGLQAILANRINLDPGGAFQEVKAWMALLLYLDGSHFRDGWITSEYGSSHDFSQFQTSGAAVRTRNASYPLGAIGALAAVAESLRQAP
jgi:2',3'-cyclic-nucleotide 2'-phosphodiesterase (5'-nucleotidase family)